MRRLLLAALLVLAATVAEAKPNMVVILMDDMPAGLEAHMPNLQRLIVQEGASLSQAYFNDPLCCPSRATMLTGRYAQNTKVTRNSHAQFVAAGLDDDTIGSWLQAAGYRTALVGKYLNGYPDPYPLPYRPPGWDFWRANVGAQAGYYDYTLVDESGEVRTYGTAAEDYTDDVRGRLAIEFIETTPAGQPLFLWLSLYAPHIPATPAPRHMGLFPGLTAPRPPSFNEADVGDKPAWLRRPRQAQRGEDRADRCTLCQHGTLAPGGRRVGGGYRGGAGGERPPRRQLPRLPLRQWLDGGTAPPGLGQGSALRGVGPHAASMSAGRASRRVRS